jgi:hypothetical protein
MLKTCQYGDCLEEIGEKGVIVTLKTPTFDEEKRAGYCCASHAASALIRLSMDRKEPATLDVALAYARQNTRPRWIAGNRSTIGISTA